MLIIGPKGQLICLDAEGLSPQAANLPVSDQLAAGNQSW